MSAPRASNLSKSRAQMQTLTSTYMVVIKNYDHLITWLKHKLDETNKSIVKNFFKTSFYIYLNFKKSIAFLDVHIREKQHLSLMYTIYVNASNNTPSYTHVSSNVVSMVHSPTL